MEPDQPNLDQLVSQLSQLSETQAAEVIRRARSMDQSPQPRAADALARYFGAK